MASRRFLAPQARQGSGHGYYSQPQRPITQSIADDQAVIERVASVTAMCDEPEALDADDYKRHIDKRAKVLEEQRLKFESRAREQERRLLGFEERLVTAQREARRRCVDVTSEVRLLKHMQRSGKQIRHLEQRLGVVERKVWRELAV